MVVDIAKVSISYSTQLLSFRSCVNIHISNINVQAESFCVMEGNPNHTVVDFVFKNVTVKTKSPVLQNKYKDVKVENVSVNGAPLIMN